MVGPLVAAPALPRPQDAALRGQSYDVYFHDIEGVTYDAPSRRPTWNEIAGQWPWETPRDWSEARSTRNYVHRSWGWGSTTMLDCCPESLREPAADAPREGDGPEPALWSFPIYITPDQVRALYDGFAWSENVYGRNPRIALPTELL